MEPVDYAPKQVIAEVHEIIVIWPNDACIFIKLAHKIKNVFFHIWLMWGYSLPLLMTQLVVDLVYTAWCKNC